MKPTQLLFPLATLAAGVIVGYSIKDLNQYKQDQLHSTVATTGDVTQNEVLRSVGTIGQAENQHTTSPFSLQIPSDLISNAEAISSDSSTKNSPQKALNSEEITHKQSQFIQQIEQITLENTDALDIDTLAKTESKLLKQLAHSPELIPGLLQSYSQLQDSETKEFLRSMLSASGDYAVETHALEQVWVTSNVEEQQQWLELLADTGVNTSGSREELLNGMHSLSEPVSVSTALQAIVPQNVSLEERTQVIDQLSMYSNSNDELIRSAGVEALSRWADKGNTYFLESALTDKSFLVRQTAVQSAFVSGIKSDAIKQELLDIVSSEEQPYALRMDAHAALQAYPLQEDEYEALHAFQQSIDALEEVSGGPKG